MNVLKSLLCYCYRVFVLVGLRRLGYVTALGDVLLSLSVGNLHPLLGRGGHGGAASGNSG